MDQEHRSVLTEVCTKETKATKQQESRMSLYTHPENHIMSLDKLSRSSVDVSVDDAKSSHTGESALGRASFRCIRSLAILSLSITLSSFSISRVGRTKL